MHEQSGIYAPTIRYHEGRFYMVTTVYPSRKHFYVYTDDPNGEWSDPIDIDFCVGSCDPQYYHLYYSTDNEHFTHLARQDYRYLSTETIGGFCGVHIGIFAHTLSKAISYADFDWTEINDKW